MGDLALTPTWEPTVRQLEKTDLVEGGADGVDNIAPKQLGNRTEWLERRVRALGTGTVGALGSVVTLRCGNPYLIEAPWSAASLATGRPTTRLTTDLGTPTAAGRVAYLVPATSGRIVGVSLHISCAIIGNVVADVPDNRLRIELVRFEPGEANQIYALDDAVPAAEWYGARDLLLTLAPDQTTPAREYAVICYSPWDATATTSHSTNIGTPRVHVLPDA